MTMAKALIHTTRTTLSLRQWIAGALDAPRSGADGGVTCSSHMLSPDYLSTSLQIALLLSEQICKAEELSKFGLVDKLDSLPPGNSDWVDYVRVILVMNDDASAIDDCAAHGRDAQTNAVCQENDPYSLEIQPFCSNLISDDSTIATAGDLNDEMQSFLDVFGFDTVGGTLHDGILPAAHASQAPCYFDVMSSEIIPVENDITILGLSDSNRSKERLQRVHNLGLVFYEMFSGGKRLPCSKAGSPLQIDTALHIDDGNDEDREKEIFSGMNTNNRKRHGGQSARQQFSSRGIDRETTQFRQESVDCLTFKGIPSSLSYLIYNMIDSINGDISGDEAYTNIFDVASDIKLMIEKPSTYLRDLDLERLSLTGLELNEAVFGREQEYASLECAYNRCTASGSSEIALVSGESGIGKSSLASRLGRSITANGGLFLSGKFQKHKSKPFSALATAFDEYCQMLVRERDSDWASAVISQLQMVLCHDTYHLIEVIPTLSRILVCTNTATPNEDSVNAQNRLNYLMCVFVETICSCSTGVVTLFLDDVQWADTASISVLCQVLKRSRSFVGGFFFLGCYRDDEMQNDHPFWNMIDIVRSFGLTAKIVKLGCMDKEMMNQMLSELLCLSPRLVRSLSELVFQKTKGNPLFFSQLLLSLNRDGLLHLSLSSRRWVWDEERILARRLPDDVAIFFTHSIQKLPEDAQSALFILSCFGSSIERGIVEELEKNLGLHLIGPLKIAEEECLVNKTDKMFHFCHDRVQESAYSMIKMDERHFHHAKYGHALVGTALKDRNDSMLFAAVSQMILGGHSAVYNDEQRITIAQYSVAAGNRAIDMSDFSSAFSFFTNGISFLPHNHWNDNYELSLELFELAARCSLATGNIDGLSILSDKVINHAKCFEDKLNTSFTVMTAFAYSSKVAKSIEMGLMIVLKLGVNIPKLSHEETIKRIRSTQKMLTISDTDLLNYRLMSDSRQLMAMKFLAKLQNATQQIRPALQPIMAIKMVELTLASGLSPSSPIGFACFGGLVANLNDIREGYRFVKLAKALVNKLESNEVAGEVIWLSTEIISFVEPLQTSNELRVQGATMAMAAGDIHCACFNRMSSTMSLLWTGSNLSHVKETCSATVRFMEEQGHRTALYYVRSSQKLILALIGDTSESIHDDALTKGVVENNNPRQLMILFFHKMFLSFMLDRDDMKAYAEKFFANRLMTWFLMSNQIFQSYISGLVSFRLYRETRDPLWAEKGANAKAKLQVWATQGSLWNFEHRYLLLQAEEFYCNNSLNNAAVTYDKAVSSARAHKFINDEALAHELAGKFYFETGNMQISLEHFTLAHEKYQQWGAYAKADMLFARIQEKFSSALHINGQLTNLSFNG